MAQKSYASCQVHTAMFYYVLYHYTLLFIVYGYAKDVGALTQCQHKVVAQYVLIIWKTMWEQLIAKYFPEMKTVLQPGSLHLSLFKGKVNIKMCTYDKGLSTLTVT
jgi:hypothetical protein